MEGPLEILIYGLAALFGLIWGSYLNVVVHRLPQGQSTAYPASHCPRCSSRIAPIDNVPVLSWLLLGARCRRCRGRISPRYPLVETATALIFLLGLHRFQAPLEVFVAWCFGWNFLALALIDLDRRIVPLVLTLPWGLAAWCLQPLLGWTRLGDAVATSLGAAAGLVLLGRLWDLLVGDRTPGNEGLGLGDAYAAFLFGSLFGLEDTLHIFVLGLGAAVVFFLLARVRRLLPSHVLAGRSSLDTATADRLPVVTFLSLAALWVLLLDGFP